MDASRLRLYLVADPDHVTGDLVPVVAAAIEGGVSCVQLRIKNRSGRVAEELGRQIASECRARSILFLMNDRVDLALAVGADGVHLGVDDLSIEAARRLGGPRFVIGFSPDTDQEARGARGRGADYLGVGPVFGTSSKHDAGQAIGLETLTRRVAFSGVPTIGIGGITAPNAGQVMAAGAAGVAVMGAILGSSNPKEAACALSQAVSHQAP